MTVETKATQRSDFNTWELIKELKLDMSDDELKSLIKKWTTIAANNDTILNSDWKENKAYYNGLDKRTEDIMDDKSKVTDNRIFTDMETILPIVTSTPAKPIVFIPSGQWWDTKEKIRDQSIKTQKILLAIYEDQKLQQKFEKMYRQHQIYRIGMIKYGISDDQIFADVILPPRLMLDSEATTIEDSEFIWEKIVDTAKNIINKYPDKEKEISQKVQGKLWTKLTYIEWWTDEFVVVSIDSEIILEKKKNPLFDYEGITKTEVDEFGKEIEGNPTKNNFFVRPKKPFIAFNVYNIGESIIDETTTLILCKSLQDNINDRKRQIADNSNLVWNPIRVYTWFNWDQAAEANDNLAAWDGVNLSDWQSISYVQAAPLPAYVSNDLQDTRNSIDNIFGIHDTSKGIRAWGAGESGLAREQLREWDQDRQATIGRAIEQVSEELYNAFAHLIKVFYDTDQLIPIMWKGNAEDYVQFKRDDIAEGMKIRVKPWSTIPEDKNAQKAQALELLPAWLITKKRGYEMMGIEDAEEAAKELELEWALAQKAQEEVLTKEKQEDTMSQLQEQIGQLN